MDKDSKNEIMAFTELVLTIVNYYDFRFSATNTDKEEKWKVGTKLQQENPIPDEMHNKIEDSFIKYLEKFK